MRVVDITSFFSSSCGGIKRYYEEKAKTLPARGVECHFIVPGPCARELAFGLSVLHEMKGVPLVGNAAYHRFCADGQLRRLLHKLAPDVIEIGSHYLLPTIVRRAIRGLSRPPVVVGFFHSHPRQVVQNVTTYCGKLAPTNMVAGLAWRYFVRQHKRYAANLVASRHVEHALMARGVPRVVRVGLGVDVETFAPVTRAENRQAFQVSYAGRFTKDKELPILLAAFEAVHERTGAHLRLVGDGPMKGLLEATARRTPWLHVAPYAASPKQVAEVFQNSDVVVVPSQTETFSFATAEALACGTPVLGADAGAVRELVEDSGGGAVFRAGSPDSLAAAAEGLLSAGEAQRREMGRRGRAHIVNHFTWTQVASRLHEAYLTAVAEPAVLARRAAVNAHRNFVKCS